VAGSSLPVTGFPNEEPEKPRLCPPSVASGASSSPRQDGPDQSSPVAVRAAEARAGRRLPVLCGIIAHYLGQIGGEVAAHMAATSARFAHTRAGPESFDHKRKAAPS
jgi:hypothetical protein